MRRLAPLACALSLVLAGCGGNDAVSKGTPAPSLGPGKVVKATPAAYKRILRSMRGKPVVVNYWASWCEPCEREMPRMVAAAHRYQGQVRFLGVDVEDVQSAAEAFVRKYRIPFPSVADPLGEIRRSERIVGLPVTQFYRADGELAFQHAGEIKDDELERKLREVVRIGRPTNEPG